MNEELKEDIGATEYWSSIHGGQLYPHFNEICWHNNFWYIFNLWDILFANDMVDWYKRHRIKKKVLMTMVCRGDSGED